MKVLLTIVVILQVMIIWFFFIKGNVRFTFSPERSEPQTKVDISLPGEPDEVVETMEMESEYKKEEVELVPKSTIHVEELKQALKEVLPEVLPQEVRKQVSEVLNEKETEFDDTFAAAKRKFKAVEDIDKAFEDNRDSSLEGQIPAPPEDDDSVPAFDDLDKSLRIISDKNSTPEQRHHALKVAVAVQDSNILVALPEPLHSQLVDLFADYSAHEFDSDESTSADSAIPSDSSKTSGEDKSSPKLKVKTLKQLPTDIGDFNLSDF